MRVVRDVTNTLIGKVVIPVGLLDGQTYFNVSRIHEIFKTFRGTVAYYLGKLQDNQKLEVRWASSTSKPTTVVSADGLLELTNLLSASKSCKDWSTQDVEALRRLAQNRGDSGDVRPDEVTPLVVGAKQNYSHPNLARIQSTSDELFYGKMCLDVARYAIDVLDAKMPYLTIRLDGYLVGKSVLRNIFLPYDVPDSDLLVAAKNLYLWTAWGTPASAFVWALSLRLGIREEDIPNQIDYLRNTVLTTTKSASREHGHIRLQETVEGEEVVAYRTLG